MVGTELSRRLCQRIAGISGGTCLLGFSGGKDSIAAWLQLRQYFTRIVPFHVASVPGLAFQERGLARCERFFGTPILRFVEGYLGEAIDRMVYQPFDARGAIDALRLVYYDNHAIVNHLRRTIVPRRTWVAWGINASDGIDRRIYVNRYEGRIDSQHSFYPCYDWSKKQILAAIAEAGCGLPEDYLLNARTYAGLPEFRMIAKMPEVFPADFRRVEAAYPLVRAVLARNEFRRGTKRQRLDA
jgi:hypothetical protein